MKAAKITRLPDDRVGRYTLSTTPGVTLSVAQLREELLVTNRRRLGPETVEDLIHRAKQI